MQRNKNQTSDVLFNCITDLNGIYKESQKQHIHHQKMFSSVTAEDSYRKMSII